GIFFQRLNVWVGLRPEGIQGLFDLCASSVYAGLTFTTRRFLESLVGHLNEKLALLVEHRLNDGIFDPRLVDCGAQRVGGGWLLEPHRYYGPALEIDAQVEGFCTAGMNLVPVKGGAHSGQH